MNRRGFLRAATGAAAALSSAGLALARSAEHAPGGGPEACASFPMGIEPLDRSMGGFRPGELTVLAANSIPAASFFALSIAGHVAATPGAVVCVQSAPIKAGVAHRHLFVKRESAISEARHADLLGRMARLGPPDRPCGFVVSDLTRSRVVVDSPVTMLDVEITALNFRSEVVRDGKSRGKAVTGLDFGLILVIAPALFASWPSDSVPKSTIARELKEMAENMRAPVMAVLPSAEVVDGCYAVGTAQPRVRALATEALELADLTLMFEQPPIPRDRPPAHGRHKLTAYDRSRSRGGRWELDVIGLPTSTDPFASQGVRFKAA